MRYFIIVHYAVILTPGKGRLTTQLRGAYSMYGLLRRLYQIIFAQISDSLNRYRFMLPDSLLRIWTNVAGVVTTKTANKGSIDGEIDYMKVNSQKEIDYAEHPSGLNNPARSYREGSLACELNFDSCRKCYGDSLTDPVLQIRYRLPDGDRVKKSEEIICGVSPQISPTVTPRTAKEDSRMDWCRWPVCINYYKTNRCHFGESTCVDAHAGPEFDSVIDSQKLVRICFDSLGVHGRICQRRPGLCRFFHAPSHIRYQLLELRHSRRSIKYQLHENCINTPAIPTEVEKHHPSPELQQDLVALLHARAIGTEIGQTYKEQEAKGKQPCVYSTSVCSLDQLNDLAVRCKLLTLLLNRPSSVQNTAVTL